MSGAGWTTSCRCSPATATRSAWTASPPTMCRSTTRRRPTRSSRRRRTAPSRCCSSLSLGLLGLLAQRPALAGVGERQLERRHQVGGAGRLLLGFGSLDLSALALVLDHAAQALSVTVLIALGLPVR